MGSGDHWLSRGLEAHNIERRDFLKFCGAIAAALGFPSTAAAQIAEAVETSPKPTLVWLEFQDCAGNTESLLRAAHPTVGELILDILSIDYHETIMAAAGHQADEILASIVAEKPGEYIVVVEGSIPTGANGAYCTIGGRTALSIAEEVCSNAAAVLAVGTCAAFGGLPAAAPNPTGALSVAEAVPSIRTLINLPACPVNAENITATIFHYLTFGRWPALDGYSRPLFAHGKTIHDNCERRAHYDAGQYVEAWGDEGHRYGWCLYKMGCKGPVTYQNCPDVGWNDGTNWPIGCGHPCVGCAEPHFWDRMTPFYEHIEGISAGCVSGDMDEVGLWTVLGVATAMGGHGIAQWLRRKAGGETPFSHDPDDAHKSRRERKSAELARASATGDKP